MIIYSVVCVVAGRCLSLAVGQQAGSRSDGPRPLRACAARSCSAEWHPVHPLPCSGAPRSPRTGARSFAPQWMPGCGGGPRSTSHSGQATCFLGWKHGASLSAPRSTWMKCIIEDAGRRRRQRRLRLLGWK